jgi:hypothetical protein
MSCTSGPGRGSSRLLRDNRAALGDDGALRVTLRNADFPHLADAFQISNEPVRDIFWHPGRPVFP